MNRLIICNTLSDYFANFNKIDENNPKIPVYIDEKRGDLLDKVNQINNTNPEIANIYKCDCGTIFSDEALAFEGNELFCQSWITSLSEIESGYDFQTIVAIGLYKDFQMEKILPWMNFCKEHKKEIYFLIGRDISSLTWIIAKQFIAPRKDLPKAVFSLKNSVEYQEKGAQWETYNSNDYQNKDIKSIIEQGNWSELFFQGHGIEDNLHLGDYTLCGLNCAIEGNGEFYPCCGNGTAGCFKEDSKVIRFNSVKAEKLILISCCNLPFYDCKKYDPRYNNVLSAIDGYVKNIVASITVIIGDSPEVYELINNTSTNNIGVRLHERMNDVLPFADVINIGLPAIESCESKIVATQRMTPLTKLILSRLSLYISSGLLTKEHEIYRLAQKILQDYMPLCRRGVYGVTPKQVYEFEQDILNRINPFTKKNRRDFDCKSS